MIWMIGQNTLSTFTNDIKVEWVTDMPEGCAAIDGPRRAGEMDQQEFMQFKKGKSKVLYLARNNPLHR